jgi:hypothetical protein
MMGKKTTTDIVDATDWVNNSALPEAIRRAFLVADIASLELKQDEIERELQTRLTDILHPLEAQLSAQAEAEEGSRLAREGLDHERRVSRNLVIVSLVMNLAATSFLVSAVQGGSLLGFINPTASGIASLYGYGLGIYLLYLARFRPSYRRQIGRNDTGKERLERTRVQTLDLLTIEVSATIRQLVWRQPPLATAPVTLDVTRAPDLVETDTRDVIPSSSVRDIANFIDRHGTSAVGLAGPRGVGKTTVIRKATGRLEFLGVYIQAPVHYDAADFVRVIHAETAHTILRENGIFEESIAHEAPRAIARTRSALAFGLIFTGIALLLVSFQDSVYLLRGLTPLRMTALTLFLVGLILSLQAYLGYVRRVLVPPTNPEKPPVVDLALAELRQLGWTTSVQATNKTRISLMPMLGLDSEDQVSLAQRDRSHPERVADLRGFLLRHYGQSDGREVVIAIDELDKMSDPQKAMDTINGLKDLFHVTGVHFIVSVSEDALDSYALRGVPMRDVFDSAFDTVIRVEPFAISDSVKLLSRRVVNLPEPVALLCHALSGGLPRDLIRAARRCIGLRVLKEEALPLSELARDLVRAEALDVVEAAVRRSRGNNASVPTWLLDMQEYLRSYPKKMFDSLVAIMQDWEQEESGHNTTSADGSTRDMPRESVISYAFLVATVEDYFSSAETWDQWRKRMSTKQVADIVERLAHARAILALSYAESLRMTASIRAELGLPSIPTGLINAVTGEGRRKPYELLRTVIRWTTFFTPGPRPS